MRRTFLQLAFTQSSAEGESDPKQGGQGVFVERGLSWRCPETEPSITKDSVAHGGACAPEGAVPQSPVKVAAAGRRRGEAKYGQPCPGSAATDPPENQKRDAVLTEPLWGLLYTYFDP